MGRRSHEHRARHERQVYDGAEDGAREQRSGHEVMACGGSTMVSKPRSAKQEVHARRTFRALRSARSRAGTTDSAWSRLAEPLRSEARVGDAGRLTHLQRALDLLPGPVAEGHRVAAGRHEVRLVAPLRALDALLGVF